MGEGDEKVSTEAATPTSATSLSVSAVQIQLLDALHFCMKSNHLKSAAEQQEVQHTSSALLQGSLNDTERRIFTFISELCAELVVKGTAPNPNMKSEEADFDVTSSWRYAVAMSDSAEWNDCVVPFILSVRDSYKSRCSPATSDTNDIDISAEEKVDKGEDDTFLMGSPTDNTVAEQLSSAFRRSSLGDVPDSQNQTDPNDSNLCDIEFSLAFGTSYSLYCIFNFVRLVNEMQFS